MPVRARRRPERSGRGVACTRPDDDVALLARSPHLGRLTWLDLSDNLIGEPGVSALAAAEGLPNLQYVALAGNRVDDPTPRFVDGMEGVRPLAAALMARFGHRPWLSTRGHEPRWPLARMHLWPRRSGWIAAAERLIEALLLGRRVAEQARALDLWGTPWARRRWRRRDEASTSPAPPVWWYVAFGPDRI